MENMSLYRRRIFSVCLFMVLCILVHNVLSVCHDQYFLYRQGESILQNGFSVDTEYMTVHRFNFFNNRILTSLVCYFFGSFGEIGFTIGSVLFNCFLCFLLFFLLHKYVVRMHIVYVLFILSGFLGLSFFADLRANLFMAILMTISVVTCELYLDEKISFFGMCGLWFLYGILAMWTQDSAFYMLIGAYINRPYILSITP